MEIVTWTIGPMDNNVYLLVNDHEKSIVVDPAWDDELIVNEAESKHKPIGLIILTHGHFDHCLSAAYVKEKTGAELWIHELDAHYIPENEKRAKVEFGLDFAPTTVDKTFTDGEVIKWGNDEIKIIHTPGHTPGGSCFLIDNDLITGDTLFAGSVGRWDFPGSNGTHLFKSIREKIITLDPNINIHPGHGPKSTIGHEKQHNTLLKMSDSQLGI